MAEKENDELGNIFRKFQQATENPHEGEVPETVTGTETQVAEPVVQTPEAEPEKAPQLHNRAELDAMKLAEIRKIIDIADLATRHKFHKGKKAEVINAYLQDSGQLQEIAETVGTDRQNGQDQPVASTPSPTTPVTPEAVKSAQVDGQKQPSEETTPSDSQPTPAQTADPFAAFLTPSASQATPKVTSSSPATPPAITSPPPQPAASQEVPAPTTSPIPAAELMPAAFSQFAPEPPLEMPEFTIEEMKPRPGHHILVYGNKGTGKTIASVLIARGHIAKMKANDMKCSGQIVIIAFDDNAATNKEDYFNNDPNLIVFDGRKYFKKYTPELTTKTGKQSIAYWEFLVKAIAKKHTPDYIIIDCTDYTTHIGEMAMRYDHKLKPYQGFKELVWWRQRHDHLEDLARDARAITNKNGGIIYTLYTELIEIVNESGEFLGGEERPKYIGHIKEEVQIVARTVMDWQVDTPQFFLKVMSSKKNKFLKTGSNMNVTDKTAIEVYADGNGG